MTISGLTTDFALHTMTITGQAPGLDAVNTYTDTLKFTNFSTADKKLSNQKAFSGVVLSNFTRTQDGTTYTITLNFDPAIFSTASDVNLVIPEKKVTTRSETEKPTDIFQKAPVTTNATN